MPDSRLLLGGADQPAHAAHDRLILGPFQWRCAHRATGGKYNGAGIRRAPLQHHGHHLGNHVPGPAHHHHIAQAHAEAFDFVTVVQGGIAHRYAADEDRFQPGDRGDGAGAPDLELDIQQPGQLLLRRKLAGNRPARCAGYEAQPLLQGEIIDFKNNTIDVIGQRIAPRREPLVVLIAGLDALHHQRLGVDPQAPLLQAGQYRRVLCGQVAAADQAHAVTAHFQRPGRGYPGVELAQAAGGGIARIDEHFLALCPRPRIDLLESRPRQVDLSAYFQHLRVAFPAQAQRHRGYGAHVVGNILAGAAIATGRGALKHTAAVEQADGNTIQLGFAGEFQRCLAVAQAVLQAAIEIQHVLLVEGVVERQHRYFVGDLAKSLQRRRAHPLGRGVGSQQGRVFPLQFHQAPQAAVVLGIRHGGLVQHVVLVVPAVESLPQGVDFLRYGRGWHRCRFGISVPL